MLSRSGLDHGNFLSACLYAVMARDHAVSARFAREALERGQLDGLGVLAMSLFHVERQTGRKLAEIALTRGERNEHLLSFVAAENMRAGDFAAGARLWAGVNSSHRLPGVRAWQGEAVAGKAILIASGSPLLERNAALGFGDEIFYARFAPELAKRGARVYLRTHPALYRLFKSLKGVTPILAVKDIPEQPHYCANPAELIAHLGAARECLPSAPYLSAEPLTLPGEGMKLGIAWGCGEQGPQDRYCSLAELSELAQLPGVQLYNLDKTRHAEQLRPAPSGMDVIDLAPGFDDFADTAAAVSAMDAIIATDNVIANLAGALGKRLFVLCSSTPEYRWGEGERTPWYPSARVMRQPKAGDWRGAVSQAINRLTEGA